MARTSSKPQRPQKSHKHLLTDTWFLEIGALVLAICSFIVIIVLLAHYDGHEQFQWNGVTLNTVVSVLATITRIGIVLPVAEGLAQWKWMHFSREAKPLGDFNLLDDASRGSRGSLLLLWEKKSLSLTSLGAWIVILSAAIEPFFQQILSFQDAVSYQGNSNVKIAYATSWDGGTELGSGPDASSSSNGTAVIELVSNYGTVSSLELDFQAQAAVLFGLSTDASHIHQQLRTSCPSSNCTWPSYMTLGVCSACTNLTDQVTISQKLDYPMEWHYPNSGRADGAVDENPVNLLTYALPNGINLDNEDPTVEFQTEQSDPVLMTARSNLAPSQTISFRNATTLLWSAAVLRVSGAFPSGGVWADSSAQNVHATECSLYLCIKQYNSTILNGQLTESSKDIASSRDPDSFQPNWNSDGPIDGYEYSDGVTPAVDALYSNATYFPRSDLTITVPPTTSSATNANDVRRVSVTQEGIDTLSNYISTLFNDGTFANSTLEVSNNTGCSIDGTKTPCGQLNNVTGMVIQNNGDVQDASENFFYPPVMSVLYNSASLTDTFSTLAESLTIAMRMMDPNGPTVSGQLGTLHTLLRVRWAWITLPLLCLLVSATFLMVSIWESRTDLTPLWKSGATPYLAHGLDQVTREKIQHADMISEIEEVAEGLKVRLHRGDDGVLMLRGVGEGKSGSVDAADLRTSEEHEMTPLSAGAHGPEHEGV